MSDNVNIDGGNIDGTAIGVTDASSGKFTILETSSTLTANGALTANGTLTANGALTANGGLTVANDKTFSSNKVDINGGNIDGTAIGVTATSSGKFTTLEISGALTVNGGLIANGGLTVASNQTFLSDNVNIDGGNIDGTAIGENSTSTGKFTTLEKLAVL